ncbi:MAG: endonuclease/exonuclease/phosphatase family protein [Actinobacteria bacterium]|nr:endonuclease/exonuclease/phosphatase family protein [Actinomycetota bacterium]
MSRSRAARLAWLATAPLAGLAAARLAGYDRDPLVTIANAGTPFVYLPAYGALAVGLATRRPALAATAAAIGAAHLLWTAPEVMGRSRTPVAPAGPMFRLVTSNIEHPQPGKDVLGEELAGFDADILLLQELSSEHLTTIKATGALDPFPYAYAEARRGSFGGGIWSKYPLTNEETWEAAGIPVARATVHVDGTPVRIFNVHCKAPTRRRWVPVWKAQLAAIGAEVMARRGPVIVAGDFNATFGHEPFRRLLEHRLRDAHVDAGRGLAPTWPADRRLVPALFRLDHVLVSPELAVLGVREGRGPGSDHRPVVADLALARPLAAASVQDR